MRENNLEIIKKEIENTCYICKGMGRLHIDSEGNLPQYNHCEACRGLGIYKSYIYYFIKDGICFSGDTLK